MQALRPCQTVAIAQEHGGANCKAPASPLADMLMWCSDVGTGMSHWSSERRKPTSMHGTAQLSAVPVDRPASWLADMVLWLLGIGTSMSGAAGALGGSGVIMGGTAQV